MNKKSEKQTSCDKKVAAASMSAAAISTVAIGENCNGRVVKGASRKKVQMKGVVG